MYTKLEILEIFKRISTKQELDKVLEAFCWLIKNDFEKKTSYLSQISTLTFRRIHKLGNHGN